MKFKHVLCAVDFSELSTEAFDTALELAQPLKADLHVLHVIEPDPALPEVSVQIQEKALAAMDALVSPAMENVRDIQITTEITTGNAATEILNCAHERNVELIVMGTQGLTLPGDTIVGGTARQILDDAPCSVMAVRPAA